MRGESHLRGFSRADARRGEEVRRFVSAMRLVVRDEPGPENLHRKKIMERLKIKATRYYELRGEAEKNLV